MIVLTDREVSNGHGTGVLLKNIIDTINHKQNVVLCKEIKQNPFDGIQHYLIDDYKLHRPSDNGQKVLLSNALSSIYSLLKKSEISGLPLKHQNVVLITIFGIDAMWAPDALWASLKLMRFYPEKKYIIFMMDNFVDFELSKDGQLAKRVFTVIAKKAVKRFAISKNLASYLEKSSGVNFDLFFGPRIIDWHKVNKYHKKDKIKEICLIGNVYVEDALSVIDSQLEAFNLKVTWFTNHHKFDQFKNRFNLKNFIYGGSYSSEEVIEQASQFRYGLILYGLEDTSGSFNNRKLQEFSIPSKILDYCIGGVEPLYYGPFGSACYDFLSFHNLGFLVNSKSASGFFEKFDTYADDPIDLDSMMKVLQNSSTEHFKKLVEGLLD